MYFLLKSFAERSIFSYFQNYLQNYFKYFSCTRKKVYQYSLLYIWFRYCFSHLKAFSQRSDKLKSSYHHIQMPCNRKLKKLFILYLKILRNLNWNSSFKLGISESMIDRYFVSPYIIVLVSKILILNIWMEKNIYSVY